MADENPQSAEANDTPTACAQQEMGGLSQAIQRVVDRKIALRLILVLITTQEK
jgi:hypothetical protein